MAKVRYTIRLYRLHDLDLITFTQTREFDFLKGMYSVVTSFAKGEAFVIELPPLKEAYVRGEMPTQKLRRSYMKTLVLDTEKDKEAIALLAEIQDGYRNNFLKNLMRQYLCYPISEDFLVDKSQADTFAERFQILRTGKRLAKAGKWKPSQNRRMRKSAETIAEEKRAEEKKAMEQSPAEKKPASIQRSAAERAALAEKTEFNSVFSHEKAEYSMQLPDVSVTDPEEDMELLDMFADM